MRKRSLQMVICCLVLLLCAACVSCGPSGPPRITEATMGAGADENDAAAHPTNQFTTTTAKLYCVWKAEGIQSATPVRGVWMVDDVGDAAPPNSKIDEASVTIPSSFTGNFSLKPTTGLPPGKYHIDIYLGGTLAKTVPFTVKAAN